LTPSLDTDALCRQHLPLQQRTALTDSLAGQAAWILERFWAWTDCDGHPENIFNRDDLLDNVMHPTLTLGGTKRATHAE
jgi:hypothetical protein